jgi:hypothetical protein
MAVAAADATDAAEREVVGPEESMCTAAATVGVSEAEAVAETVAEAVAARAAGEVATATVLAAAAVAVAVAVEEEEEVEETAVVARAEVADAADKQAIEQERGADQRRACHRPRQVASECR